MKKYILIIKGLFYYYYKIIKHYLIQTHKMKKYDLRILSDLHALNYWLLPGVFTISNNNEERKIALQIRKTKEIVYLFNKSKHLTELDLLDLMIGYKKSNPDRDYVRWRGKWKVVGKVKKLQYI